MTYMRVIPRDLFNEASLLKCIGQLVLLIHDNQIKDIKFEHNGESFDIVQNEMDGSIYVENVEFFRLNGKRLHFSRPLNSRQPWPLYLEIDGGEYEVFNDEGKYILDFDYIDGDV